MTNTLSRYIFYNCKDIICQDSDGNIINGIRLDSETLEHNNIVTTIRFIDGYIDGDVFDEAGNFKMQLPAIESKNHKEYWRKNKIHRDGNLPAIISGDPPILEYWKDGIRQPAP